MILIYPPVSKPCEPPAGVAMLSGAMKAHGIRHRLIDANLEGLFFLFDKAKAAAAPSDNWTRRALKNISRNLRSIKDMDTYGNIDRYKRSVLDLNRVIETSSAGRSIGLANYQHPELSPLRSGDLLWAAEHPEENQFYPYFEKRLSSVVREEQPSSVGISLNYLSQALCTFSMIGFLRREFPGIRIILGGGLITSWMRRPNWKDPFGNLVDHLVDGPGEYRLLSLLGHDCQEWGHIPPAYDSLPLDDYLSPGLVIPYRGASGCYWNRCSFCPEKAEGNRYIPVPAEKAVSDMAAFAREEKPLLVHLLDSAVSGALMKALIADPPGVPWYGFARIDGRLADPDFCVALKRSGCVMLKLGLESGDQGVLDRMEKGTDLGIASRALKALKQAGIAAYVYLLFGTPAETIDGARKTLDFTVRHSDEIGFLNLAIFNMPVCAPESGALRTSDFYDGDLSLYTDFMHPAGWGRKEVRFFLENEFRKHPAISAILKKDPPIFTSNHAPFFTLSR